MSEDDLEVAKRHHRLWCFWMESLLLEIEENEDGSVTIPADKVKEIRGEIAAKYEDLSRQQKAIYEGTAVYEIQDTRPGIDW
jgi:hypothetical protein